MYQFMGGIIKPKNNIKLTIKFFNAFVLDQINFLS